MKAYPTQDTFAGDRHGPDEEHEASSVESDHESDDEAEQDDEVEGIAEETFMSPEDDDAIRDDTGNWSDEEIPRPIRADTLQAVPAAVRREVRKSS